MNEQLALPVPGGPRRRPSRGPRADVQVAPQDPVAVVLVDTPLAHLDRPFEYLVPATLDEDAHAGVRVRVRFAGRDHDGFLLERRPEAEHRGRLSPLRSVLGSVGVLTSHVAAEARAVADHYGGTAADVLRLAVPPRHARAERAVLAEVDGQGGVEGSERSLREPGETGRPAERTGEGAWAVYPAGPALLRRLADGQAPVASWIAAPARHPGEGWAQDIARAVAATRSAGRGAVVVVPDHRDVDLVVRALTEVLGEEEPVERLTADLGPEARYRAFLRILLGRARVAVGNRAAAFAPVRDLGLLVCWDEADDLHREPRAPYPHVREVLRFRARQERAALLLGGYVRSVEAEALVRAGAAAPVEPVDGARRRTRIVVAGEGYDAERDAAAGTARIPSAAWRVLKDGLARGPVLVQVPRRGYVTGLSCQDCRRPVRCPRCSGPVGTRAATEAPACLWCGCSDGLAGCAHCGSTRRRAGALGERRTAEELGRSFPGVPVISSGGDRVLAEVPDRPGIVVATPGAEPVAPAGYAAVVLLDGWRLLERPHLDAAPEALRRWCAAAALCAPPPPGGRTPGVVLCGVPAHAGVPAVEALVRWDPAWLSSRELDERRELGLPPVRRHAVVTGPPSEARAVADELRSAGHDLLGEVPSERRDEVSITVAEQEPGSLAQDTHTVRARRSAEKVDGAVRIVLDAVHLG